MAVTAIWSIKGGIGGALDYANNPEKTVDAKTLDKADAVQGTFSDISRAIAYAENERKTTLEDLAVTKNLVTGINCGASVAYFEMMEVKKKHGKTGGITAHHAYQSFSPGEGTPETIHEIGVKLAQEIWGDRFQVVVATHLDKGHLHNHFIINSVSFIDGSKYNGCKESYRKIREVSDRLCVEHGLSVIKDPAAGQTKSYLEWRSEKDGMPTMRSLIKTDVDRIISESMTDREFFMKLKSEGYSIKQGKDITLIAPGRGRGVKLARNFGGAYTIEAIRRRILMQAEPVFTEKNMPVNEKKIAAFFVRQAPDKKITGYKGRYARYLYELTIRPGKGGRNARMHFLLREDIGKLDRLYSEMTLLRENRIETADQLAAHKGLAEKRVADLIGKRKEIGLRQRRAGDAGEKESLSIERSGITGEIRYLRREIKKCESIAERSGETKEKLRTINQDRKQQAQKEEKDYGRIRRSR